MMKDYIFLAVILLLRFPQSYFNKKTSGMVNGAAAYFLYGAYSYLLAGGAALIMLLGSMLSNGMIMVAQKMFSKFLPDVSASVFSFLAFGLVGVGMLACLLLRLAHRRSADELKKMPKNLFLYGIILSGILLVINQLATVAGRAVPSAVMFPINDGGATIISAVTAAIFFKERLTARSVCGLLLGIASLMIINLC